MLVCKSSKANIEGCTKLFLMMGLVLSLFVVNILINYKFKSVNDDGMLNQRSKVILDETFIPETKYEEPKEIKAQQPPTPTPVLDDIKVVDDDKLIKETIITSTEVGLDDAVVVHKIEVDEVVEVNIEEEVVEDVPFLIIEKVPVFPGCTGDKETLKKCMQDKIQQHIAQNFNNAISENLGLESGVQRIFVMFVIDQNGQITDIKTKAPHKALEQEAKRVIGSLPKMKPGEQRGRAVRVKYSLPIVFRVINSN